jgi:hypothetical protein
MTGVRVLSRIAIAALLAACAPTPQQRADSAELHDLGALKQRYPDVVVGFDLRLKDTVIISLNLQNYIQMDDDAVIALKRDALERWRTAWTAQHPHQHAVLHVRLIDFIGRKVAEETTQV